jgi:ketosteroid isomerase-like protein
MPRSCAPAVAVALSLAACSLTPPRPELGGLVASERAFARLADEIGVRPAFAANFADDAVWMTPAPTSLAAAHAARPAPADPRAVRLEWHPAIAAVAASGDFGFTSGPSTLSLRDGGQPPRHGVYLSVWKHDAGGRWRVAIDAGVASDPLRDADLAPPPAVRAAPPSGARDTLETIVALERAGTFDAPALRARLASDALLLAERAIVRGTAVAGELDALPFSLEPLGGAMASSRDLAYTYGRWKSAATDGHYVHVWTRGERGEWRIAIVMRP